MTIDSNDVRRAPRPATLAARAATALLALAALLGAGRASAAIFTVDVGTDTVDVAKGNGVCADATGHCSLRAAIEEGNNLAGDHVINIAVPLVTVGANGSLPSMNARYVLNGNLALVDGQGLYGCLVLSDSGTAALGHSTGAAGSTIMNVAVGRCSGSGISANGHGYTFLNNRIGVDPTGTTALPNSGNGIDLTASAVYPDNTTLQGIYDLLPPSLQPVDFSKINQFAIGLTNALVAAVQPVKVVGNVISGNVHYGIEIHGTNMAAVVVSGNHIGTNLLGTAAIPNQLSGVRINATSFGNMIGPDNVISGNGEHGILADAGEVLIPNFIMGNRIGLGDDSSKHVGNGLSGIWVDTKAAGASPGPPNPSGVSLVIGPSNVVSDNRGTNNDPFPDDVSADVNAGIVVTGSSSGVKVQGNTIGMAEFPPGTALASAAWGNAGDGIIVSTGGVVIGGDSSATANVIAGNLRHGIVVKGSGTKGVEIKGNLVGIHPAFPGQLGFGNAVDGLHVDRASATAVGGPNPGEGNVVAANGRNGIALRNGSTSNGWANLLQRNQVWGNARRTAGVGIDLEHALNAADDPSRSEFPANYANGDQVQPVLCSGPGDAGACSGAAAPASSGGSTTLSFTLATHGPATFRIDFFSVNAASGNAATAASWLGEAQVTTDLAGSLSSASAGTTCTGTLPGRCTSVVAADAGGAGLLVTATDVTAILDTPGGGWMALLTCFFLSPCPVNNTSELSNAVAAPLPAGPVMATVPPQHAKVAIPYTLDLAPYVNANGSPITGWAIVSGALPAGLSLNPLTGVVSGTPTTVGSAAAAINAVNSNGHTWAPAIPFTVSKGEQVITFGPAPALVQGGASKVVTATATSTLPVTFSSLTPLVCTVNAAGTTLTALASAVPGTCTVAADQAGNANVAAAPRAKLSIPVTLVPGTPPSWTGLPATQTGTVGAAFSFSLASYATPNAAGDPILGYAVSSGALPGGVALDTAIGLISGTPSAAGTFNVTLTAADRNGPSAGGAVQLSIAKGSQSVAFGALSDRTLGAAPFSLSATATSGLAVSFASQTPGVCTVAGALVTLVAGGTCTIRASQAGDVNWSGAANVDQSFLVNVVGVTHFSVTGAPASSVAGTPFSVTVTALDAANAPVPLYAGTVHFTSTDAVATLPPDYTFGAADAGSHTFSGLRLSGAGSRTVTATDTATPSVAGTTGAVSVAPAAASHFVVGLPAGAMAGVPVTATVTALDAFGNTATGYLGTVHVTATDAAATLPSDTPFAAGDAGVHAFPGGVTLKTAGNRTVTATDTATASITGTSANVAVSAAAASHFTVATPATAGSGTPFTAVVTALDAFSNTATGYTGTVHFTSSDAAAVLPPNTAFGAGDAGVRSFAGGVTLSTTGNQTLTATDTATPSIAGTSASIAVSAAGSSTGLASSANPSVFGQIVTLTATVVPGKPGAPTGTVSFSDGAAPLCAAVALDAAFVAHCATSTLAPGPHPVVAVYSGDATYAGSTSSTLSQVVNPSATTSSITGHTPSPSTSLQPITATVSVAAVAPGAGTPTGTVTVTDGAGATCTITLPAASCDLLVTSAGAKTLSASYGGDANFSASVSAPVGHTVSAVTSYTATTGTLTGQATATLSGAGCTFTRASFVPMASLPAPAGVTFPQGLFDFEVSGCGAGGTATIQVVYPQALPPGTQYWKYGPGPVPQPDHWYPLMPGAPNFPTILGNAVTFTITDGGLGDDDLVQDGRIVDEGGPGAPAAAAPLAEVPTLSGWGLVALGALVGLGGVLAARRLA